MKQTAGNVFLDSNVLIYCYTITEQNKQQKAFQVIDNSPQLFVSTQVLQEFCNVAHKKFSPQNVDLETALSEIESLVSIYDNNIDTIRKANCNTLYSEDIQHGHTIEDKLKIVNPFI